MTPHPTDAAIRQAAIAIMKMISKGDIVMWQHREFPERPDGTTATDRAGWLSLYRVEVVEVDYHFPQVRILEQVQIEPGRDYEFEENDETQAIGYDLQVI